MLCTTSKKFLNKQLFFITLETPEENNYPIEQNYKN